ncbi:MAG: hypothetical protein QNJ32_10100 [Xenococcaceae cyanobacterium MO_167.B27]|nr:hypothetical protein [Xenococcaceae cyanobacterium MO_167.B27]
MMSKIAWVASRSRDIMGNMALRTSFSRVSSPFQSAGARSRIVRSSSKASAAFDSSSTGH